MRSQGDIPEAFLRGCGVPDSVIAYAWSLVARPIEFYSCFISYSTKDQAFAERLHADLQEKGIRCWLATEDLDIGDPLREKIDVSIRLHDKLLLVLSEHSVRSDWVEDEVEAAFAKERSQQDRQVLFPIRLDGCINEECAPAWVKMIVRKRFVGDFSGWKEHDRYRAAFDRLLRALKVKSPAPA